MRSPWARLAGIYAVLLVLVWVLGQFRTLFAYPGGIVAGNLIASAIWAAPALLHLHIKLDRQHKERMEQALVHHREQLKLLHEHHRAQMEAIEGKVAAQ